MKKGLVFFTALVAATLGLAACNNGGGGKTYTVTITNKEALAEIVEDDETKSVSVTISDVITGDAYQKGDLVVTSDDESVLQIKGNNRIKPVAAGETTVRAIYKNKFKDSVNVKIVPTTAFQMITNPQPGEDYVLAMTPASGKMNYAVGGMDGYYLKSGTDKDKAAVAHVELANTTGDYKYKITLTYVENEESVTKTIGGVKTSGHINIGYVEDASEQYPFVEQLFKLNDDYSFSTMIDGEEFWIGTYSTYYTFSYRNASQIAYKAHLYGEAPAIHATSISITEGDFQVKAGGIKQLHATMLPENATDTPKWYSDNKEVATVDAATGLVTGVSEGTAHITAEAWVGINNTVTVTVAGVINYGSEEEPLTVEQAKALLDADFADGTMTPKEVYVTGVVSSATYSEKYKNWTIWLYDGETAEGFELYATGLKDGIDSSLLKDGAVLKAKGQAKIHGSTYELTNNSNVSYPQVYYLSYTAPALTGIEVAPATASVNIHDGEVTKKFDVSPVPANAEFVAEDVEWTVAPAGEGAIVGPDGTVSVHADAVAEGGSKEYTVTAHYGDLTSDAVLTVTNEAEGEKSWQKVTGTPVVGTNYRLALDRGTAATNPGFWYLTDTMSGYYLTTDADPDKAAVVSVVVVDGGYNVKLNSKYLSITETSGNVNVGVSDDPVLLQYNLDTFGITVGEAFWGLGTRSDQNYTTVGRTNFTQYPNNFKVFLMEYKEVPPAPELTGIVIDPQEFEINIASGTLTKQYEIIPTPAEAEVKDVQWYIGGEPEGISISEDGLLTVSADLVEEGGEPQEFNVVAVVGSLSDSSKLTVKNDGSTPTETTLVDASISAITPSAYTNNYTGTFTATANGVTLTYSGINDGQASDNWTAWRFGRKSNTSVPTIQTTAISGTVNTINFEVTQFSDAGLKSAKLYISSDGTEFAEAVDFTSSLAVGTVAIQLGDKAAAGLCYKLVFDMDVAGSNGTIRFSGLTFVGYAA